jgi:exopolyphosphatase/guanosine-5'-triphosphate,3'-diphosphate pyrophosphatase
LVAAEGNNDTGAPARALAPAIYGALDLGTNNCRLLIANPRAGALSSSTPSPHHPPRRGVLKLRPALRTAMSRTIEALKVCAEDAAARGRARG